MRSNSEVLRRCSKSRSTDVTNFLEDSPCQACGNGRVLQTSWANVNLGRRFVDCPNDRCKDFEWFDPPMWARSMQIIPRLLRVRNNMENELSMRKKKEKMLWIALTVNWVMFAYMWFLQM
ncbi:hypothetical protein Vadar_007509 [Vaccinium darrowii]|uniref:Uncharacterized protein n=1 Tax=Vaccinium darrowii TaxID=229202 RepID=A0ACB7YJV8_9ERIC|nr:hypothetical protein Vadar_007509 [Vaccinium darrowii]